ncbi:MAG: AzlD domain-containing protein [Ruminococcaceae bacterium]|nr:AzlD domain-containing protein [Oscillospiraceae bacterium]
MNNTPFWLYLLVMAGVTYLIRMLPMVLLKKRIQNRFILSFLHYIPYTVLSVMTIPAIFAATSYRLSAWLGFLAAVVMALCKRSLVSVAAVSCCVVFVTESIIIRCL